MTIDSTSDIVATTHRPVIDRFRRSAPMHEGDGAKKLADVKKHAAGAMPASMSSRRVRAMQYGHIGCRD